MSVRFSDAPSEALRRQLERYAARGLRWQRLSGGRTNALWRVTGDRDGGALDWVVKLYDPTRANALFPNDGTAERAALRALATTGLAPELIDDISVPGQRCLIYGHMAGRPLVQTDAAVLAALGRLHAIAPPEGLRQIDGTPAGISRQAETFLHGCMGPQAAELWRQRPVVGAIAPAASCFLHGDPTPANALVRGDRRCFVDWQCPGVGDPVADLAIALSPAMHYVYGRRPLRLSEEETALTGYPKAGVVARYRHLRPLYRWRMAAYCLWKASQGEVIYAEAAALEIS